MISNVPGEPLARRLATDGEFRLAARYWTGSLTLDLDTCIVRLDLADGAVRAGDHATPLPPGSAHVGLRADAQTWARILAPVPPPFFNDIFPARAFGLAIEGDTETLWQYYAAIQRVIQVIREEGLN